MRKLMSLLVSALILAVLYWRVDFRSIIDAFAGANAIWLAASLTMVVPLTALTAHRLSRLLPDRRALPFGASLSLTLAGSAMNLVLPSKMGDVAKGWFLTSRGHLPGGQALSLVVFEKGLDMLSLLLWCALGLGALAGDAPMFWPLALAILAGVTIGSAMLFSQRAALAAFGLLRRVGPERVRAAVEPVAAGWTGMQQALMRDRARLAYLVSLSIFIWFLHLLQIWMFILALNAWTPFLASLALAPLAILAGLLPFTFAGVGTRDAALVILFQPWLAAPVAAALGVLCTMRYLLPGLGGLPVLSRYLSERRAIRAPES